MKIVHEINGTPQVAGSADLYHTAEGKKSPGFRVDLLATSKTPWSDEEEVIYIEGDARAVYTLAQEILKVLEIHAEEFKDELDANWKEIS